MRSGDENTLPVLAPGTPVLVRTDARVQVGHDPRSAVVLPVPPGVDPRAVAALLQLLRAPLSYRSIARRVRAAGLDAAMLSTLVGRLVATGKAAAPTPVRALTVAIPGIGPVATALHASLRAAGYRVTDTMLVDSPGLVVVADQPVPDPEQVKHLTDTGTPHLSVHVRDGIGVVGPLVLPGSTSCLRCVDLHRTDLDPEWPVVAAALSGVAGHAADSVVEGTVAVARGQIDEIASIAPARPSCIGRVYEYSVRPARLTAHAARPHPRCGCVGRST